MSQVDVIGGVYGESCAFPFWNEVYGSAGRAAAGLGIHVDNVVLHSVLPPLQQKRLTLFFNAFDVDVEWRDGTQFVGFDYLHCMSDPMISPSLGNIEVVPAFKVKADVAILFGMMECCPKVEAVTCVYDPQSPGSPKRFRETGSTADRLAFVANAQEIRKLTGMEINEGAMGLARSEGAEIVVAKCGLAGARIFDQNGEIGSVPAFVTKNVFTIGSGDVFVAAFTLAWAIRGAHPVEAARYASLAVAEYIETSSLPLLSMDEAQTRNRLPVEVNLGEVYLAGPFRELGQRVTIDEARTLLSGMGLRVFSPVHDIGHGPAHQVVKQDLEALDRCDCVLAILKGSSPGTVFEVGYAIAKGKPVFCVAQNMRENDLKLPSGAGAIIHNDFVSAIHQLAWRK